MEYRHLWSHCTPTKQSQKMFSNHVIAIWWTHYNMAEWIPILIDRVKNKKIIGESLMMTSMSMTTCSTATYSSTSSTTTGPANSAMKTLWVWGPYKVCITNPKVAKLVFYTQGAQSSQWSEEFYDLRTIVWGLNSYRNDNEFHEDDFGASRAWYLYNPGIVCGYFTCQTRAKPPLNVILILELLPYILI